MFGKEKEKLTEEDMEVLHAVYLLVQKGEIPFSELEPLVNSNSKIIESYIKETKEDERQSHIRMMKMAIERQRKDVESTEQELDKYNKNLDEMRAELEDLKSKKGYERDEYRIRNLLWWIFNNEEEARAIEDKLASKEAQLKIAVENLLKEMKKK